MGAKQAKHYASITSVPSLQTAILGPLLFLLLLSLLTPFTAAAQVDTVWARTYKGPGSIGLGNVGRCVEVDRAGNAYVTGESEGQDTTVDYATLKYSPSGVQRWVSRYGGSGTGEDRPVGLAVDERGNVYVTGMSNGVVTSYDFATVKYDSSGNQRWVARYNGRADTMDFATAITVDVAGNCYVTGGCDNGATDFDYTTIKYNPVGETVWVREYAGNSYRDVATSVAVDDSLHVYVTGVSGDNSTLDDAVTIKYDRNGNVEWIARYDRQGYESGLAIALDSSGNVYVAGDADDGASSLGYLLVKYNARGDTLWSRKHDPPYDWELLSGLVVDPTGNAYVTGWSRDSVGDCIATVKYDGAGNQLWDRRYRVSDSSTDYAADIALDRFGSVYVSGNTFRPPANYALLVKYNSAGVLQWAITDITSPTTWSVAVDSAGFVYTTGGCRDGFITAKCRQTNIVLEHSTRLLAPAVLNVGPVPFTDRLSISLSRLTKTSGNVNLRIYDASGRSVRSLPDKGMPLRAGGEVTWDGKDDRGRELAAGVYFCLLKDDEKILTRKVVLVR